MISLFDPKTLLLAAVCVVTFPLSLSATPWQLGGPAGAGGVDVYCGNPFGFNSNVANAPIVGRQLTVPFIARESGPAKHVHWFSRHAPNSGYSKGDGGIIRISIHDDDGGKPGGMVGTHVDFEPNLDTDPGTTQDRVTDLLPTSAIILKGQKYWIVFDNVHPNSPNNYLSLNGPLLANYGGIFGTGQPLDIARPRDAHYLYQKTNLPNHDWESYKESNNSIKAHFPMVMVRVGESNHGFPFMYGPLQIAHPSYQIANMPKVSGLNRVRQTANFKESEFDNNVELHFFAQELTAGSSSVAVLVNDVFQGCVEVSDLGWYSVPVDVAIESGFDYTIEFLARSNADVVIMGAPCRTQRGLDYNGRAELSTNSGAAWEGFPVSSYQNHPDPQLCFYFSGQQ